MSDYNVENARLRPQDVRDRPVPNRDDHQGERPSLFGYFRSIWPELKKVVWPSRRETTNYSIVVLFTLILMLGIILMLDNAFSEGAVFLFK